MDAALLARLIKETPAVTAEALSTVAEGSPLEAQLQGILDAYDPVKHKDMRMAGGRDGIDISTARLIRRLRDDARGLLGLAVPSPYDLSEGSNAVRAVTLRGQRYF